MEKNILITGGAGFIGSHVIRLFVNKYPNYHIVNFDALTYAGNLENLIDIENKENYTFIKGNINQIRSVEDVFNQFKFDGVINLAAETHVDRSISDPNCFIQTNIIGTTNLLNIARESWKDNFQEKLFYQISTDEVYGSLGEIGLFTETSPYNPQSPYSASKASADHFVKAYGNTYEIPFVISNCSNNYGPNQFPEKLIPLVINNIKENKMLPIYGDGKHCRDWLYVTDHAKAIDVVFHKGKIGESYNIGALNECQNIHLVKLICQIVDEKLNRTKGSSAELIRHVIDRPGHDRRYAIDTTKINNELGWFPSVKFEEGLNQTVDWYLNNQSWLDNVRHGIYQSYYQNVC
ncbi:unnamed protein product [Rotaria magnacalcarata]|uniref:dTDP-D-glucose 4,6-dehydratase n=1 Tax=Rotaria magnacalcarata TaxID=392030 RepID=A0A816QPC7_9BILA|nr:unnamed protein product [Rotaria magnacalcarata]CAF2063734.1 unnamed protein product [Rotaria magnacalcarata]CAF2109551.1 unnamed protein product [Rotaria magnacalcarata]CAF4117255.1 unnamed protein product [Rotaria magnacalcarata]CAF4196641.1 unnamed protein product [Rotaria magnacalcarata]